ncbi:hypothetical protein J2T12_000588 [Paenibacillus anaericanus]|uniref:FeoB-associated Cys-rich membrane protein n=1 Tax=Paenibacillus anaericanus TaxID=170367 RepID=A0A3S1BPC1_9BACL|nr:FeoB-associated Cys-rich membrane protein [Paenibacillus anaericanus]MDQ0087194.1 hypothetical protein [Paenibacillus anaericanus]RUT46344.1 FeoB-associated Cys-rich membrane protein [Paenibacillus anaericanus]
MIDFLIIILLAGIIGFTVWRSIKKRKSGGGGCAGCSGSCAEFSACDIKEPKGK